MSLFRCGGGGGKLDETVLWTNPNLTSDFASQTVTLSDDVDNYDYIKFVFNLSTTAPTQKYSIFSVGELKTLTNPTNDWSRASSPMRTNSNNVSFVRGIIYQSSNTLAIGNASGYQSSSTSNSALIPYQIIGMKYGNKRPSTAPNILYSALKSDTTANSYTFTQDYDTVYVINTSTRTAGSGLVVTQVATPNLSVGTTNTIYNSGKVNNGIVVFLELNNVKSGDSVAVNGPNTGLIDSMIIFTI